MAVDGGEVMCVHRLCTAHPLLVRPGVWGRLVRRKHLFGIFECGEVILCYPESLLILGGRLNLKYVFVLLGSVLSP